MEFNLPGYKIDPKKPIELKLEGSKRISYIHVLVDLELDLSCPRCGGGNIVRYGVRQYEVTDIPLSDKTPVKLVIHRKRFKCNSCSPSSTYFSEPLTNIDEKHRITIRAMKDIANRWVQDKSSFATLGDQFGIGEKTVRNIVSDYFKKAKQIKFATPKTLGIHMVDVFNTSVYVFTNVEKSTILAIIPNDIEQIMSYLDTIERQKVKYILLDLGEKNKKVITKLFKNSKFIINPEVLVKLENSIFHHILQDTIFSKIRDKQILRTYASLNEVMFFALFDTSDTMGELADQIFNKLAHQVAKKGVAAVTWLESLYSKHKLFFNLFYDKKLINKPEIYQRWVENILQDKELSVFYKDLINLVKIWEPEIINAFTYEVDEEYIHAIGGVRDNLQRIKYKYLIDMLFNSLLQTGTEITNHTIKEIVEEYRYSIEDIKQEKYGIDMLVLSNSIWQTLI